jgi:MFS family permease
VLIKFTLVDPRGHRDERRTVSPLPPLLTVVATLWRQQSLRHLSIALVIIYGLGSGLSSWFAAFLIRSHGMGTREVGVWLGLILSLGGAVGTLAGGYIAVTWFAADERDQMRMSALSALLLLPAYAAFLTLTPTYAALIALALAVICIFFSQGPAYALMQRLVPDEMRATAMGIVMLLVNLIGTGVGPQIVGILSDLLAPRLGSSALRSAMLATSFAAVWAAYHFWRVAQTVGADLAATGRMAHS